MYYKNSKEKLQLRITAGVFQQQHIKLLSLLSSDAVITPRIDGYSCLYYCIHCTNNDKTVEMLWLDTTGGTVGLVLQIRKRFNSYKPTGVNLDHLRHNLRGGKYLQPSINKEIAQRF